MADFPFDIVGFDLDGTLIDTSGDLAAAVNHALAAAGRETLPPDRVRPMIGGGAKAMLRLSLDVTGGCGDEEFRRLSRLLLGFYESNLSVHSRPFPGALDAVEALRAMGVKTAIVTNKFERFAIKLIGELDLTRFFDTVIGGDTLGPGRAKPGPDPVVEMMRRLGGGRAAFVGDSVYDTMAARAGHVPSIGCAFGFLNGPVEELGADAVISSYAELIPTLRRLSAI